MSARSSTRVPGFPPHEWGGGVGRSLPSPPAPIRAEERAAGRRGTTAGHYLLLSAAVFGGIALALALASSSRSKPSLFASAFGWFTENSDDRIDEVLQTAATNALGERSGSVIIMDPQTGRIRAVVNSKLAFEESFRPGSTLKPLTALAALRSGTIDEGSESLCREKFAHGDFHTTCSHPRELPPLNPTEAIAYSCNYYFGKVGERVDESSLNYTLGEFGFGKTTGINKSAESAGKLLPGAWRPQSAMGEGNYLQTTPIQLVNAYSALVNGGHLFTPRLGKAKGFIPKLHTEIKINHDHRALILKGMRGAVRYGTAESAGLYSLPVYTFGKTGTATEINGFRMQGWFVGFASAATDEAKVEMEGSALAPDKAELAVLVFLSRGHGANAAEVARPIFAAYARAREGYGKSETQGRRETEPRGDRNVTARALPPLNRQFPFVRVYVSSEKTAHTLSLEDYVRGVVAAEGSTEREVEALKALAVASRTYALKNLNRHSRDGYDFCTTTHCQRYRPAMFDSADISSAVIEAAEKTKGEALTGSDAQVADSYFSASCGGATANLTALWGGNSPPHLQGVRDDDCAHEPHGNWTDTISQVHLLKALKSDERTDVGERLHGVRVMRTDRSGRAELLALEGDRRLTVKGWDFKIIVGRALGWNLLKSSRFTVERSGPNFVFHGSGFGHGLGLCQEGAHVMAKRGATYRQILAKYFPGTEVVTQTVSLRSSGTNWLVPASSADLLWNAAVTDSISSPLPELGGATTGNLPVRPAARRTLSSESFRINYPVTINQREIELLLNFLQSNRRSLVERITAFGVPAQFPALEIFINETTGDFVGRTRQPPWAAAATQNNRIELQPLATLKRRRILETTLRHELVHVLVDSLGGKRTPRWLAEGLALHYADEGRLIARYEQRKQMTVEEMETQLAGAKSAGEMKTAYAAAYREVKRLISHEGEANVWRRVTR